MADMSPSKIIGLVVALLLIGILLPIGLTDLLAYTSTDSTIQTLVSSVIPIMAIIGLVLAFVPRSSD
jgi:fumarate reductase subunit D